MSDILDRKIAEAMKGEWVRITDSLSDAEVRDSHDFHLVQLSRLTAALDILFPDRPRAGVASIQAAIDIMEELVNETGKLRFAMDANLAAWREAHRQADKLAEVKSQRDEARAIARVLAHAYERDSRPPGEVVRDALAFPVMPEPL